ncbi:hypothetical protein, partial [Acinetobacter baumannii]|uniref:hypothetical protein n=1 Tax=Acinetobacter baumannii TaxID=470 RepID=UPI003317E31D
MSHKVESELVNRVLSVIDENWDEEVEFLQKLGSFPSTLGNEADVQHYIANFLTENLQLET